MDQKIQLYTESIDKNKESLVKLMEGYHDLKDILQTFSDLSDEVSNKVEDAFDVDAMMQSFENLDPNLSKWEKA